MTVSRKSQTNSPNKAAVHSPKRQRVNALSPCTHIDLYTVPFVSTYLSIASNSTSRRCSECDRWDDGVTLFGCASCGVMACLDADTLHLPNHFNTTPGHCVAVSPHTGILYCWQCQQFIWTGFLESLWSHSKQSRGKEIVKAERLIAFHKDDSLKRHCVSLRGLYNLGKTCFMNCTLQVLVHNPHLFSFFLAVGHDVRNCKKSTEPVATGKKRDVCIACEVDSLFVEVP